MKIKKHFLNAWLFPLAAVCFSLPALAASEGIAHAPGQKASAHQTVQADPSTDVVNINTADVVTIKNAHLKEIGQKRAEAIVAYREKNGPYKSVDDLKNIHGITQRIIDENRSRLTI